MFESLGVSPGQIMYLGKVGVGVKEQPLVVVEVCAALNQGAFGMGELVDVVGHGLPAVGVDGSAAPAFVVLLAASRGSSVVAEDRGERCAVK